MSSVLLIFTNAKAFKIWDMEEMLYNIQHSNSVSNPNFSKII